MKRTVFIFIGIITLIAVLLFAIPIEITTQPLHSISIGLLILLIGSLFYNLFKQSLKLEHTALKIVTLSLTILLFVVYLLFGFDEVVLSMIVDESMPIDVAKYENENGEVIIEKFHRISGSIHHSDLRKVYYDFGNGIRISQQYRHDDLIGDWIYHDLETDSIYSLTIRIEDGEEYRYLKSYEPLE